VPNFYDLEQRIIALEAQLRAPSRERLADDPFRRTYLAPTGSITAGMAVSLAEGGEVVPAFCGYGATGDQLQVIGIAERVTAGTPDDRVSVVLDGGQFRVAGLTLTPGDWYAPPYGVSTATPGTLVQVPAGMAPVACIATAATTGVVHVRRVSNRGDAFPANFAADAGHNPALAASNGEENSWALEVIDGATGGQGLRLRAVIDTTVNGSPLVHSDIKAAAWPWANVFGEADAGWSAQLLTNPDSAGDSLWTDYGPAGVRIASPLNTVANPHDVTGWTDLLSWTYDGTDLEVTGHGDWIIDNLTVTGTITASVDWSGITGKPSTFPPDAHTHPPSQIVSLTLNNMVIGDASNVGSALTAPTGAMRSLNWDGTNVAWTDKWGYSGASTYLEATAPVILRGQSVLLSGGSAGAAATTAASGQGFGAMYSSTRAVAWRWDGTVYALADGVLGSLDGVIEYTPSATAASRKLDAKCDVTVGTASQGQLLRVYYGTGGKYVEVAKATGVVTIKGASGDIVIDPALVDSAGKAMSLREIDVCDAGVAKKQLILASAPY
jgi:hypothetical protein